MARGIGAGPGDHSDEHYRIVERECAHGGADRWEIVAWRTGLPADVPRWAAADG